MNYVITIEPDGPALLAQRLVKRLLRADLICPGGGLRSAMVDAITEALADEIHQDVIDSIPTSVSKCSDCGWPDPAYTSRLDRVCSTCWHARQKADRCN